MTLLRVSTNAKDVRKYSAIIGLTIVVNAEYLFVVGREC